MQLSETQVEQQFDDPLDESCAYVDIFRCSLCVALYTGNEIVPQVIPALSLCLAVVVCTHRSHMYAVTHSLHASSTCAHTRSFHASSRNRMTLVGGAQQSHCHAFENALRGSPRSPYNGPVESGLRDGKPSTTASE